MLIDLKIEAAKRDVWEEGGVLSKFKWEFAMLAAATWTVQSVSQQQARPWQSIVQRTHVCPVM